MAVSEHEKRAVPTNVQLLRRMIRFILPVKGIASAAVLMVLLWMTLDVLSTRMMGTVINAIQALEVRTQGPAVPESFWQAAHHEPVRTVMYMVMVLGLLVLLGGVVRFIREFVNSKFTMDMVYHMRAAVYDRLQRVGFGFYDEHSSGALINRALSDLQNVRAFLQMGIVLFMEIVAFVLGYWIVIMFISPWLGLAALVPVPVWIWYILRFSKKMQPAQMKQMKAGDDMVTVFTENVAGVHVVKAFAT